MYFMFGGYGIALFSLYICIHIIGDNVISMRYEVVLQNRQRIQADAIYSSIIIMSNTIM